MDNDKIKDKEIKDKEIKDEEIKNDEILEKDYLSSLIGQEERLVYYEIENIYMNPKKRMYKNKFSLKKEPPILTMRDDCGNQAEFYLTENLTDELIDTLGEVKRAYLGFSGPTDINAPSKFVDKIKYYIKNNLLKVILTILIIIVTLILYNM